MKWMYTLPFFLLASLSSHAQKLTGIWRGTFVQKNYDPFAGRFVDDRYRYEIQINQLDDHTIEGVTYSYKNTVFYGKATFHGMYTQNTRNVLLKEIKMLELKISDKSEACLMTCYLDYAKEGDTETLTGTYTSVNETEKTDCGGGTVFLERVSTTDFKKEDFLTRKAPAIKIPPKTSTTPPARPNNNNTAKTAPHIPAPAPAHPPVTAQHNTHTSPKPSPQVTAGVPKKPGVKPGAEDYVVRRQEKLETDSKRMHNDTTVREKMMLEDKKGPGMAMKVPQVLLQRENPMADSTIYIDASDVRIDYYDNGEIDNDTITVYHNNVLAIDHGRLSYSPLTIRLHLDADHVRHEIITVANNLGDTPPNTAAMVITWGKHRYEVAITSDEKTNAKVVIEYRPKKT